MKTTQYEIGKLYKIKIKNEEYNNVSIYTGILSHETETHITLIEHIRKQPIIARKDHVVYAKGYFEATL